MSAANITELQGFVKFSIYTLSFVDELTMNQPINIEKHNQHGFDIGLSDEHYRGAFPCRLHTVHAHSLDDYLPICLFSIHAY